MILFLSPYSTPLLLYWLLYICVVQYLEPSYPRPSFLPAFSLLLIVGIHCPNRSKMFRYYLPESIVLSGTFWLHLVAFIDMSMVILCRYYIIDIILDYLCLCCELAVSRHERESYHSWWDSQIYFQIVCVWCQYYGLIFLMICIVCDIKKDKDGDLSQLALCTFVPFSRPYTFPKTIRYVLIWL